MSRDVRWNRDYLSCFWVANFFCGAFFFCERSETSEVDTPCDFKICCDLCKNKFENFSGVDFSEEKLTGDFFD